MKRRPGQRHGPGAEPAVDPAKPRRAAPDPAPTGTGWRQVRPTARHAAEGTPAPPAKGAGAWIGQPTHWGALVVFGLALLVGCWNVAGGSALDNAEGAHVARTLAVLQGGPLPDSYAYEQPPLGWAILAVLGMLPLAISSGPDLLALRYVAGLLLAVTATLVFLLARRLGSGLGFAFLAAAVATLSPIALSLGRQVSLDVVGLPWVLLAVWLALSPRRKPWAPAAAGAAFGVAVLSELGFVVFGPAVLIAILIARRAERGLSVLGFLGASGLVVATYPMMAILRGQLVGEPGQVSLLNGIREQVGAAGGSGSIWQPGSARQQMLLDWLAIDPILLLGGLVAAAVLVIWHPPTRWVAVAVAGFAVPLVVTDGHIATTAIVTVVPFLGLALGVGAEQAWSRARAFAGRRKSAPLLLASTAILAAVALVVPAGQWAPSSAALLSRDQNTDWRHALDWVDGNLPRTAVVVVPEALSPELRRLGWQTSGQVMAMDEGPVDARYGSELGSTTQPIDWIVEGPTGGFAIEQFGPSSIGTAYQQSVVVESFGDWHIRQVVDDGPDPQTTAPDPVPDPEPTPDSEPTPSPSPSPSPVPRDDGPTPEPDESTDELEPEGESEPEPDSDSAPEPESTHGPEVAPDSEGEGAPVEGSDDDSGDGTDSRAAVMGWDKPDE